MGAIDTVVVVIIIAVGLIILYKALKEPLDMFFGLIWKGLIGVKDKLTNDSGGGNYYESISYR